MGFWCFQFCLSQLIPWCYLFFFLIYRVFLYILITQQDRCHFQEHNRYLKINARSFQRVNADPLGRGMSKGESKYFLLYLCAFCCDTGPGLCSAISTEHCCLVFPNTTSQSNGFKVSCVTRLFRLSLAFLVLLYLILYKQYISKYSNWEKSMSYSGHKSLLSELVELLGHWLKMGHVDFELLLSLFWVKILEKYHILISAEYLLSAICI